MAHKHPRVAPSVLLSSLNGAPTISLICHLLATLTLRIKVAPVTPNLVSKYSPMAPWLHPLPSPAPLSLLWFIFTFSQLFLLVSPIGYIKAASSGQKIIEFHGDSEKIPERCKFFVKQLNKVRRRPTPPSCDVRRVRMHCRLRWSPRERVMHARFYETEDMSSPHRLRWSLWLSLKCQHGMTLVMDHDVAVQTCLLSRVVIYTWKLTVEIVVVDPTASVVLFLSLITILVDLILTFFLIIFISYPLVFCLGSRF